LKTGKYEGALSDYGLALEKSPQRATALFGRGIAELRTGNSGKALEDFAAAEKAEPGITKRFARYGITR
jgi:tetratricopeptide (TPR) repeat protein